MSEPRFEQIFEEFFGQFVAERQIPGERIHLHLTPAEIIMGADKPVTFIRRDLCERCRGSGDELEFSPASTPCPQCKGKGEVRSLDDTFLGKMVTKKPCPKCGGRGKVSKNPCQVCKGHGYVTRQAVVNVTIPAGAPLLSGYKVEGEGNVNLNDGARGGVTFLVVPQKSLIEQKGDDFRLKMLFDDDTLEKGGSVTVLTAPKGNIKIDVPPKTKSGTKFVLAGLGALHKQKNGSYAGRGDLTVTVEKRLSPLAAFFKSLLRWR